MAQPPVCPDGSVQRNGHGEYDETCNRHPRSPRWLWLWFTNIIRIETNSALGTPGTCNIRLGIKLSEKTTPVLLMKHPRETPRPLHEWLNVLDLDDEDIARLGGLNLERARAIVDLREVDVLDIIGRVVVFYLPAHPVYALDSDHFAVADLPAWWDCLTAVSALIPLI